MTNKLDWRRTPTPDPATVLPDPKRHVTVSQPRRVGPQEIIAEEPPRGIRIGDPVLAFRIAIIESGIAHLFELRKLSANKYHVAIRHLDADVQSRDKAASRNRQALKAMRDEAQAEFSTISAEISRCYDRLFSIVYGWDIADS